MNNTSKCQCVRCQDCSGTGKIYLTMADDLDDEYELCDSCDGSGWTEICAHCRDLIEDSNHRDNP